jgi:hypothetical protein
MATDTMLSVAMGTVTGYPADRVSRGVETGRDRPAANFTKLEPESNDLQLDTTSGDQPYSTGLERYPGR